MESFQDSINQGWDRILQSAPEIAAAAIIMLLFWLSGLGAGRVIRKTLGTDRRSLRKTSFIARTVRWILNLLGVVVALHILGLTQIATSFLAAGGVAAVILGFAFKEIGENLLAGVFLSFSRSFEVGDIIESNDLRGVVRKINVRDVHIRTADGCDIYIPSAMIFKNPLLNFTRDGLRRINFLIGLDYGNDMEQVGSDILSELQSMDHVLSSPEPAVDLSSFGATFAELEVSFWINTFETRELISVTRTDVMKQVLDSLKSKEYVLSSSVTTAIDHSPITVRTESKSDKN